MLTFASLLSASDWSNLYELEASIFYPQPQAWHMAHIHSQVTLTCQLQLLPQASELVECRTTLLHHFTSQHSKKLHLVVVQNHSIMQKLFNPFWKSDMLLLVYYLLLEKVYRCVPFEPPHPNITACHMSPVLTWHIRKSVWRYCLFKGHQSKECCHFSPGDGDSCPTAQFWEALRCP